jgi:hypothetical protein
MDVSLGVRIYMYACIRERKVGGWVWSDGFTVSLSIIFGIDSLSHKLMVCEPKDTFSLPSDFFLDCVIEH